MAPIARPPPSPIHRPPRPLDPPTPGDFRCAWTYRQRVEKAILSWNREVTSAHLVDALAYEAKIFMALPDHVVGIKPPEEQCLRNEIEALRARLDKLEARLRIFEESSGRKCNALSHDKAPSIGRKSSRDTYSSATDSGLAGSDTYVNSPLVDKESIPSDQEAQTCTHPPIIERVDTMSTTSCSETTWKISTFTKTLLTKTTWFTSPRRNGLDN